MKWVIRMPKKKEKDVVSGNAVKCRYREKVL
jgi:hypothetical protein